MNKIKNYILVAALGLTAASCSDFLDKQVPQGALFDSQVEVQKHAEEQIISAYASYATMEDINASFSLWNFDVRSDDAYKGGNDEGDGGVFHSLEIEQGVLTTDWNLNDIWTRFYNVISRVNKAIKITEGCDESFTQKEQRLAELYFLRAYAHFQLKRLFKNIPFVVDPNISYNGYGEITNTEYSNDEGWGVIIKDLENAYNVLPTAQAEKGRPTKMAAAALMAKVYLYKAYHQDNAENNEVTGISEEDLNMVLTYTETDLYEKNGIKLEADMHNNFRPEERYENGCESVWAIQYSRNDGTKYGTLNWGYGLICPNIAGTTDGGCDFYKPSQNLVNAFKTNAEGYPMFDDFNNANYNMKADNADPRLFLTVGLTGLPYMFNRDYIMDESSSWSRSGGKYGYYVTLKHNVDPALKDQYLIKGSFWASPMNRIVLRYADVLLMRAEAFAQLGKDKEAVKLVNEVRRRAAGSTAMIENYPSLYGVKFACKEYNEGASRSKDEMMKIVKMERRLELAMESDRFFDLVRWGDAEKVLNEYYSVEKGRHTYLGPATFTKNRCEYLPIPHKQIADANGHYKQNCGGW